MNKRPKLGRPYGSKTFREPYGVRYARRYLELWAGEGMRPTDAAKKVAAESEWRVAEADVFHAYKRHSERLRPDIEKALRANYVWFGRWLIRQHPNVADAITCEWVRGFDPAATAIETEAWLAFLGRIYLDFIKPKCDKFIR